jgi:hypothetical protein
LKRLSTSDPVWLVVGILLLWGSSLLAEDLRLQIESDRVRVSAPQLHFLTGHPLERLHNGAAITYLLQLTVRAERAGRVLARIPERFTVSYDLWEEKFSVTRHAVPARSASNLSIAAVESWCIENISLSISDLPADRPFWVTLEYQSEEPKDQAKGDPVSLTLGSLIDIFSRRTRDDQEVRGSAEAGPLRLEELRKKK